MLQFLIMMYCILSRRVQAVTVAVDVVVDVEGVVDTVVAEEGTAEVAVAAVGEDGRSSFLTRTFV